MSARVLVTIYDDERGSRASYSCIIAGDISKARVEDLDEAVHRAAVHTAREITETLQVKKSEGK